MLLMLDDLESKLIKNSHQIITEYIGEIKILRKNKNCIVYPKIIDFNNKKFGSNNMIFNKSIIMESNEYKLYYFENIKEEKNKLKDNFNKNLTNPVGLINYEKRNQEYNGIGNVNKNGQKLMFCPVLGQNIIDRYTSSYLLINIENYNKLLYYLKDLDNKFKEYENNENKILGRHPEYIHFNSFLAQQIINLEREINEYEVQIENLRLKIKELEDDIKILNNNFEVQYENKNYCSLSYYIHPKNFIGPNTDSALISEFKYIQIFLKIKYLEASNNNYQHSTTKLNYEQEYSNISSIFNKYCNDNYSNTLLKYKHIINDMELKIRQLEYNLEILITSCL